MRDGLLLGIGTLTRLPVPPPRSVDRRSAGMAMSLAPLIALALGAVCALPLLLPVEGNVRLLAAALAITALAWCTRALHLDGLADTVDALGSGRPADQALEIARRSDIGPFGVVALVLALLIDVIACSALSYLAAVLALVISRTALSWGCAIVRAARPDGLGAVVARTVPTWAALAWSIVVIAACWLILGIEGAIAALAGLAAGGLMLMIARRRLGGITGDVLGAVIELAFAAALIAMALLGTR